MHIYELLLMSCIFLKKKLTLQVLFAEEPRFDILMYSILTFVQFVL